jgi:hypothetical protein
VDEYLARVCCIHGLKEAELVSRRKEEVTAYCRELLLLVGAETYVLRVEDLAERLRMDPGSASRVLARGIARDRECATFHKQRLGLARRLGHLERRCAPSRR